MIPAVVQNSVCLPAADKTGQYVRQLLEPAFTTVPAAVDIPALFQSALPDVFYESQRLQNEDMKFYLAPVSKCCNVQLGNTHCSLQALPCWGTDGASRSISDLHL